jgi:hypothetical protein
MAMRRELHELAPIGEIRANGLLTPGPHDVDKLPPFHPTPQS